MIKHRELGTPSERLTKWLEPHGRECTLDFMDQPALLKKLTTIASEIGSQTTWSSSTTSSTILDTISGALPTRTQHSLPTISSTSCSSMTSTATSEPACGISSHIASQKTSHAEEESS